jgi:hypothetical protein
MKLYVHEFGFRPRTAGGQLSRTHSCPCSLVPSRGEWYPVVPCAISTPWGHIPHKLLQSGLIHSNKTGGGGLSYFISYLSFSFAQGNNSNHNSQIWIFVIVKFPVTIMGLTLRSRMKYNKKISSETVKMTLINVVYKYLLKARFVRIHLSS